MRITWLLILPLLTSLAQAEPTTRPASPQTAEHTEHLKRVVARCDQVLKESPDNVSALQGRAEANYRLGQIEASLRDFDRVVKLDAEAMPHNWQRGIALYHAGRFKDGAKQFERHREVNPNDVENAAFHFICVARQLGAAKGPPEAVKLLIPIQSDPRVPLMKVHAMYAGKAKPEDVIEDAKKGNPDAEDLKERLFYAHLYIGLWHDGCGRAEEAAKHIKLAATDFAIDGYMGDVARVHYWLRMSTGK